MVFLFYGPTKKTIRTSLLVLMGFCLTGCSMMTIDTMRNEPLLMPIKSEHQNKDDIFIGIAMSGGGSRASNFSAAVLLELEKLGILQHAAVISSVSGSSLTAAYYGLYGNNREPNHPWNEESVRKAFLTDFQSGWIQSWFNPWNVMRYWLTNLTRSDIMIEKLNDELYDGKQYKELIAHFPQILINATSYNNGQPFVFTKEHFANRLISRRVSFGYRERLFHKEYSIDRHKHRNSILRTSYRWRTL
jgi:predicted acylesterase/phospholipase RssA